MADPALLQCVSIGDNTVSCVFVSSLGTLSPITPISVSTDQVTSIENEAASPSTTTSTPYSPSFLVASFSASEPVQTTSTSIPIVTPIASSPAASTPIASPTKTSSATTSHHDYVLSPGAIAGIAIGTVLAFIVALALLWLAIRRKQRQWSRKTIGGGATAPPRNLEEAEEYTVKLELDSQDTAMKDAGIAAMEGINAPHSPVAEAPPMLLHSKPDIPHLLTSIRNVPELSTDQAAYFYLEL